MTAHLLFFQEGLEKTGGDQHLADKLARVETGNITDSSGNVRQRTRYDSSGTLLWYQEFTYDAEEGLSWQSLMTQTETRPDSLWRSFMMKTEIL